MLLKPKYETKGSGRYRSINTRLRRASTGDVNARKHFRGRNDDTSADMS
jgi:hypothetical protein